MPSASPIRILLEIQKIFNAICFIQKQLMKNFDNIQFAYKYKLLLLEEEYGS